MAWLKNIPQFTADFRGPPHHTQRRVQTPLHQGGAGGRLALLLLPQHIAPPLGLEGTLLWPIGELRGGAAEPCHQKLRDLGRDMFAVLLE